MFPLLLFSFPPHTHTEETIFQILFYDSSFDFLLQIEENRFMYILSPFLR